MVRGDGRSVEADHGDGQADRERQQPHRQRPPRQHRPGAGGGEGDGSHEGERDGHRPQPPHEPGDAVLGVGPQAVHGQALLGLQGAHELLHAGQVGLAGVDQPQRARGQDQPDEGDHGAGRDGQDPARGRQRGRDARRPPPGGRRPAEDHGRRGHDDGDGPDLHQGAERARHRGDVGGVPPPGGQRRRHPGEHRPGRDREGRGVPPAEQQRHQGDQDDELADRVDPHEQVGAQQRPAHQPRQPQPAGAGPEGHDEQRRPAQHVQQRERLGERLPGHEQHGLGQGQQQQREQRPARAEQPGGEAREGGERQGGHRGGEQEQPGPAADPPGPAEQRRDADEELRGDREGGGAVRVGGTGDGVVGRGAHPDRGVPRRQAEDVEARVERHAAVAGQGQGVRGVGARVPADHDVLPVGERRPQPDARAHGQEQQRAAPRQARQVQAGQHEHRQDRPGQQRRRRRPRRPQADLLGQPRHGHDGQPGQGGGEGGGHEQGGGPHPATVGPAPHGLVAHPGSAILARSRPRPGSVRPHGVWGNWQPN